MPPFTLCVSLPQTPLLLPSMSHLPITGYDSTLILIITCEGDYRDILQELQYLSDPVIIVSNMLFVTGFARTDHMLHELKSVY